MPPLWTIGHSTRTIDEFLELLRGYAIRTVADVRLYPGSRRMPHFNREALARSLQREGITYVHMPELGGRRKAKADSHNTAWRNEAFRGYADYMETEEFTAGMKRLEMLAVKERTAVMCAEALWWRCHRSLIADFAKAAGWNVVHILGPKSEPRSEKEHPYTGAAAIVNGKLSYRGREPDLFDSEDGE